MDAGEVKVGVKVGVEGVYIDEVEYDQYRFMSTMQVLELYHMLAATPMRL